MNRRYVIFDLETTGVDPKTDRIVQIAWLDSAHGAIQSQRINPGIPIPSEATAVHGITDADVAHSPLFMDVAPALWPVFQDCDIGGFNIVGFDIELLAAEFARAGIDAKSWPSPDAAIVDAYKVWMLQEPRTLAGAHDHYLGRPLDGAHDAEVDVMATARVIDAQASRYGAETMAELADMGRDPSFVDRGGAFRLDDSGQIRIHIGKHKGQPLSSVPSGYLDWMRGAGFARDTLAVVVGELDRRRGDR